MSAPYWAGQFIQTLSINGNNLSINPGNTVTLPGGGGGSNWWTQTAQGNVNMGDNAMSNITYIEGTGVGPFYLNAPGVDDVLSLRTEGVERMYINETNGIVMSLPVTTSSINISSINGSNISSFTGSGGSIPNDLTVSSISTQALFIQDSTDPDFTTTIAPSLTVLNYQDAILTSQVASGGSNAGYGTITLEGGLVGSNHCITTIRGGNSTIGGLFQVESDSGLLGKMEIKDSGMTITDSGNYVYTFSNGNFYTSSVICSTINGIVPSGGGGSPSDWSTYQAISDVDLNSNALGNYSKRTFIKGEGVVISADDGSVIISSIKGVDVLPALVSCYAEGGSFGKVELIADSGQAPLGLGGLVNIQANSAGLSLSRININAATTVVQGGAVDVGPLVVPGAVNILSAAGTGVEVLASVGPINIASGTTTTVAGGSAVVLNGSSGGVICDSTTSGNSKILVQDIYAYEIPTIPADGEYLHLHGGADGLTLSDTVSIEGKPGNFKIDDLSAINTSNLFISSQLVRLNSGPLDIQTGNYGFRQGQGVDGYVYFQTGLSTFVTGTVGEGFRWSDLNDNKTLMELEAATSTLYVNNISTTYLGVMSTQSEYIDAGLCEASTFQVRIPALINAGNPVGRITTNGFGDIVQTQYDGVGAAYVLLNSVSGLSNEQNLGQIRMSTDGTVGIGRYPNSNYQMDISGNLRVDTSAVISTASISTLEVNAGLNYASPNSVIKAGANIDGFAEVTFQNLSAGSNAATFFFAVDNTGGEFAGFGQNSLNLSPLYNTLFELPGSAVVSGTLDLVLGPQSDHSSNSGIYMTYQDGAYAHHINSNGALSFNATYNGTVNEGDFGLSNSILQTNGSSAEPTWTSTPTLSALFTPVISTTATTLSLISYDSINLVPDGSVYIGTPAGTANGTLEAGTVSASQGNISSLSTCNISDAPYVDATVSQGTRAFNTGGGLTAFNGTNVLMGAATVFTDTSLPSGKGAATFIFPQPISTLMGFNATYVANSTSINIQHPIWVGNEVTDANNLVSTIQVYGDGNLDINCIFYAAV